jgi:seryl-tRNA(Sec) selenium transferase
LAAIQYALASYENVETKTQVATSYAKLQAYVKEYNEHAQTINTEFTDANEVAVSIIASVFSISSALAALLFILKGKL